MEFWRSLKAGEVAKQKKINIDEKLGRFIEEFSWKHHANQARNYKSLTLLFSLSSYRKISENFSFKKRFLAKTMNGVQHVYILEQ